MALNPLPYDPNTEFTWKCLQSTLRIVKDHGYQPLTCKAYFEHRKARTLPPKPVVFRIDVDRSPKKSMKMASVLKEEGIPASFFYRLHAPEYNPLSFDNMRIIREVHHMGFEIGLHTEMVDGAYVWKELPENILRRDLLILSHVVGDRIVGVASHRNFSGLNNLDFWATHTPAEFDLWYEAYDQHSFGLFQEGRYISDSELVRWKAYDRGELRQGDFRSLTTHILENCLPLYVLLHPFVFRTLHFFEE